MTGGLHQDEVHLLLLWYRTGSMHGFLLLQLATMTLSNTYAFAGTVSERGKGLYQVEYQVKQAGPVFISVQLESSSVVASFSALCLPSVLSLASCKVVSVGHPVRAGSIERLHFKTFDR